MTITDQFIKKLKRFRLNDLASKSGVSKNTIHCWRKRYCVPSLDNAERVSNAMGYELQLKQMDNPIDICKPKEEDLWD